VRVIVGEAGKVGRIERNRNRKRKRSDWLETDRKKGRAETRPDERSVRALPHTQGDDGDRVGRPTEDVVWLSRHA
jgi:hypothetical protein